MMSSAIVLFRFFSGRVAHPASVCISIMQVFSDWVILVFLAFLIFSAASFIVIFGFSCCGFLVNIYLQIYFWRFYADYFYSS